jgi:pyridinium-3,5-bisthiocarboxylic acid mononucleotide nickel chelatase
LAAAEAFVHGIAVDDVAFHEVGAQDSIADVCAAAVLLDRLAPATTTLTSSCSSLPIGSGTVRTAHGDLPVPAPATLQLLQGFLMHDDGRPGERITPTGAAILAHLQPGRRHAGTAAGVGIGFGTRVLVGMSNITRLSRFTANAVGTGRTETVGRLSFDIDDQTGEDLAIGLDRLRATAGVLDVLSQFGMGKKGRTVHSIQVLCEEAHIDRVVDCCLNETTTLGVRMERIERRVVPRSELVGDVRRKGAVRPSGRTTIKVEADELQQFDASTRADMKRRWEQNDD